MMWNYFLATRPEAGHYLKMRNKLDFLIFFGLLYLGIWRERVMHRNDNICLCNVLVFVYLFIHTFKKNGF